jgi:succinyl-CoA synthetase alpha subunit
LSIYVDGNTRLVVQGITGNAGRFQTPPMLHYGTRVVAGVSPGHAGEIVEGVPVYNSLSEAVLKSDANTSIVFVPAPSAAASILEAVDCGIKTIIVITEGIPQQDAIDFLAKAERQGLTVVGPNCPGVISPAHRVKVGIMPGHIFRPGRVGIASRSGTLTYEIAWHISQSGAGQSTCVGIGGDPIVGLDFISVLELFKLDQETESVVLIGEIGGDAEERAAEYIAQSHYPKPVVAYIAGKTAPQGKRMGHAGAIIMGKTGTASSKVAAFQKASVAVADKPSDVVRLLEIKCGK